MRPHSSAPDRLTVQQQHCDAAARPKAEGEPDPRHAALILERKNDRGDSPPRGLDEPGPQKSGGPETRRVPGCLRTGTAPRTGRSVRAGRRWTCRSSGWQDRRSGSRGFTVLKRLKDSTRSCRFALLVKKGIWMVLTRARSTLKYRGPRKVFRPRRAVLSEPGGPGSPTRVKMPVRKSSLEPLRVAEGRHVGPVEVGAVGVVVAARCCPR